MPETAPLPTPEREPAWRAAILAYREQRRDGASHHTTWLIAVVALREVWPLPLEDAKRKTTHAIRARITRSGSGMG